jgi:hypothetical protein
MLTTTECKEVAKHIPDANFISLSGLAHIDAYENSSLILPHVKKFLSSARSTYLIFMYL